MTNELLLTIIEGFTVFKYKGRRYAYKSLGEGSWTPQCASLELMNVLKNYFIESGKMEKGGFWPDSRYSWAWTSDVFYTEHHVLLCSNDRMEYSSVGLFARFAVLPLDSERKINAHEKDTTDATPVPEGYTAFEYEGRRYAYKSLGDGAWTPQCASLELMKVLKNYFIESGKMEKLSNWPGSSYHGAWTSDVYSYGHHVEFDTSGITSYDHDGNYFACFAVLPLDSERKNFIKEISHENETL